MKTLQRITLPALILCPVLGAGFAPLAAADVLDTSKVPAEARWVVHIDVEAALGSDLVRQVRKHAGEVGVEVDEALAEMQQELGINPLEDLLSVTIYGFAGAEDRGVAILRTTDVADRALAELRKQPGFEALQLGDYPVMGIGDGEDGLLVHNRKVEGSNRRTLLLAGDRESLLIGLRTFDGKRDNLNSKPNTLFASPAPGSFFFASIGDEMIQHAAFAPASQLTRLMRSVVIDVGEHEGWFYGHASVETADPKDARNIQHIIRGGLSMLTMAASMAEDEGDADAIMILMDLADALEFDTNGAVVSVRFVYESKKLIEELARLGDD